MLKHIIYLVFCFSSVFSNAQSLDISNSIPNNNKIIILGEAHRIKENYPTQLELIKLLHKSKRINCLIIEKSSSSQVIIDNLIRSGDTSGIYYLLPKIMCDIDSCVHDLNPYKDFIIELTSYSKANNLPIFCLDIEENYQKTKGIIFAILDSVKTNRTIIDTIFLGLKQAKNYNQIQEKLLKLNNKTEDLRLALDQRSFEYISTILNNVKLDNELGRTGFFLREKYLYEKINNLLKENKRLKPFMIYGLAHTHKFYSEKINMFNNNPSVAYYLQTQKGSKCRGKVFTIVTTYFFKEDSDSLITSFKYFEKEDLLKIRNELSDFNHKIINADSLDFNVLIPKSYDMIIALNNCHKLLQHTRIYYKNTQSKQ